MTTLYLECGMGAAGDMLTAALLELVPEPEAVVRQLNGLGLPGVTTTAEKTEKCGITGTHMRVLVRGEEEHSQDVGVHDHEDHTHDHAGHDHCDHDHGEQEHEDHAHEALDQDLMDVHDHAGHGHPHHHHHHTSLSDVERYVAAMPLPEDVRQDIVNVYHLIAEAESHAHGMPVDQIHFHEVGTMDAVMDVTAVCLLMHLLHPDKVVASPVRTGFGQVQCAHGIMPVPAPATAFLLQGIPSYSGQIRGEMCTPTGAALLKYFVTEFAYQPLMRVEKIGYGMGTKDFPAANCLRAYLGSELPVQAAEPLAQEKEETGDTILELCCNLDDMTGEEIGFAMEQLFAAGARDVFTTPIYMKKNRPGILLTVICTPEEQDKMVPVIFRYTTTIGIRRKVCKRSILKREEAARETPLGVIRVKKSVGFGVVREKAAYDDLQKLAEEQNLTLEEARRRAGL